jgi:hypothetical protein
MKKLVSIFALLIAASPAFGQAISSNGGSIQGTVSDPTGAAIPGASITVSNPSTGFTRSLQSDGAGFYSIGPLIPGGYTVSISAPSFSSYKLTTVVRTGTVTSGNAKLVLGKSSETVDVNAGQIQINTDQAGVQDVLTKEQVDSLAIDGRNFLALAGLQPGVLIQSGETFDPTKAGYQAISVDGVSGRTTRILYDGQDITDETVGTTIINVPTGAVDEFQINRSTQDVSGEVTSTGQVLVSSPSGTNKFHGQEFYFFQDSRAIFALGADAANSPFQRNQFGGSIGGPIIKDKLFFFVDSERIKQTLSSSATGSVFRDPTNIANDPYLTTPILLQYPTIPEPFKDTFSMARLDYNGLFGGHYFARIFYEDNSAFGNYGNLYSTYANRDNVPGIVGGADFTTGRFTHSIRGGYEKFHNLISDTTVGSASIYNPNIGLQLSDDADGFYAGPNFLAPQATFQSDKQLRYDGTWTKGRHSFKYGASLNRILGGGDAFFFGLGAQVDFSSSQALANCGNNPALGQCLGDPLNGYSANGGITISNGNGVFTEKPGFGLPGGGVHDWRSAYYVADTFKASSSVTLIAGLRYSIDTDRANQDLPTPKCADAVANGLTVGCTGNSPLLAQLSPVLSTSVHQPYGNIAPQAGLVFSPGAHRLSLRAGVGMFFENDIFNNTGNARATVLNANGPFFGATGICGSSGTTIFAPGGTTITTGTANGNTLPISTICTLPIGQAAPYIVNVQSQYQNATKANNSGPNPNYIGAVATTLLGGAAYASPYRTPYSVQFNGGVQYEVVKGTIISADYLHNGTVHVPLIIDVNRVGAANTLNKTAAQNAIAKTLAGCGAASINAALTPGGCPGGTGVGANGQLNNSATIVDFAGSGLDSSGTYLSGFPAQLFGLTPNTGGAFGGLNPNFGLGQFIFPTGQSGYDALQIVLKQNKRHPAPGIVSSNLQISYSLSRIVSDAGVGASGGTADQFFNSTPYDYNDPKSFTGRNSNDHTNELSFGGTVLLKYGPQLGLIGHFFSAGATSLTLPTSADPAGSGAGEIFRTDVTGDGTVGDLVPGTAPGAFMHQVKPGSLGKFITQYNATQAGTLTPAGQALVTAGLFTQAQLVAAGAVKPVLQPAPANGPIPNAAFRALDASLSYPISFARFREGLQLVPGIAFYNVANLANFNRLTGQLQATPQSYGLTQPSATRLNGTNSYATEDGLRVQRGSGTFDAGGPRTTEFQLKLNF